MSIPSPNPFTQGQEMTLAWARVSPLTILLLTTLFTNGIRHFDEHFIFNKHIFRGLTCTFHVDYWEFFCQFSDCIVDRWTDTFLISSRNILLVILKDWSINFSTHNRVYLSVRSGVIRHFNNHYFNSMLFRNIGETVN